MKHEATTLQALDAGPQCVTVNDKLYLIYKAGEEVYAYQNHCPHQGGPVLTGRIDPETQTITCPWHGWTFELAGGTNPFSKPPFVRELPQAETSVEHDTVYLVDPT